MFHGHCLTLKLSTPASGEIDLLIRNLRYYSLDKLDVCLLRGGLKILIGKGVPLAPYQPFAKLGPIILVVPSLLRLF